MQLIYSKKTWVIKPLKIDFETFLVEKKFSFLYFFRSHYVAISIKKNKIYYFDSFGKNSIKDMNLIDRMKQSGKKIYYSTKQIQSFDSYFCGYYSLVFLLLSELHRNPIRYIDKYFNTKTNLRENEKVAIDIIKKAIRNSLS